MVRGETSCVSQEQTIMQTVNVHEAETHLARLLEAVEQGEEIIIARADRPIATLTAYRPARRKIAAPGSMQGQNWRMLDDFDEPLDEFFDCLKEAGPPDDGVVKP
jgi:antitoxin (DNA-binding transcriptional repressor) of toxin-antitoxin stability system